MSGAIMVAHVTPGCHGDIDTELMREVAQTKSKEIRAIQ